MNAKFHCRIGLWCVSAAGILLTGCISTPQTKALLTPIGAIGIHSFAPPHHAPYPLRQEGEFEQQLAHQDPTAPGAPAASDEQQPRS